MINEKQKFAAMKMIDRFLFEASSRGINDQDRLIRLVRKTLKPKNESGREILEFAIRYISSRTIRSIKL